jgi:hypothetical protein
MGKQRREQSRDSIFVDNPFVDGFLERIGVRAQSARKGAGVDEPRPCVAWFCAGSREGRQCIRYAMSSGIY